MRSQDRLVPNQDAPIRFQDLMRHRVRHILLVSSLYDSFILAEDGQLNQAILNEYVELNLSGRPDLTRVSTGSEALALACKGWRFDLIITSLHVGDMGALELARRVRELHLGIPVLLLGYDNRELSDLKARHDTSAFDRIFLWHGDVRILLAMVKSVEDRLNLPFDTGVAGVPVILVVEDSVRFYSSFLPVIYTELVRHTQNLISEGVNLLYKLQRMRVRPKVLLCENYETAWSAFLTYQEQVLGLISDIEFPRDGVIDKGAGVRLARAIRALRPDMPIMLQSSIPENEALTKELSASFLLKGSPILLQQLRGLIVDNFGFGDFVFRMRDGSVVGRAKDIRDLVRTLHSVPAESLGYHAEQNHFSAWLRARGEYALADILRPLTLAEFDDVEHLRRDLTRAIADYRARRDRVIVADFDSRTYDPTISLSRIGGGSLGGKARGLAFANRLLGDSKLASRFPDVDIIVPQAVVLGTDVFDEFMEENELKTLALNATSDENITRRFLAASFPRQTWNDLESYLERTRWPLAVRSSGLLEDSPDQPFAGVYETYMVPNQHPDSRVRLNQLIEAVKRVYASAFHQRAQGFLNMTHYRLEEEKMAVIIQRLVGRSHGQRFYPTLSGVARSHNFYPTGPQAAEDGVVTVALGLGKTVVDGGRALQFCPRYPRHVPSLSSVDDAVRNSQREFYALDITSKRPGLEPAAGALVEYPLSAAEEDQTLSVVASTFVPENEIIVDGTSRPGVRLVTFAPILKHDIFPLAKVLEELLEIGKKGTSSDVEIEFALELRPVGDERPEFAFLQLRPVALSRESEALEIGTFDEDQVVCRSAQVLGNGRIEDVRDILVVAPQGFDRMKSRDVALEVATFNAELQRAGLPYVLIGVGRWGTTDPFLGIPVTWNQIAGARVIVEASFEDLHVEPSQGSHFFQNLTSCNIPYFTVAPGVDTASVDWSWLASLPAVRSTPFVRHVRLQDPMLVTVNGKTGEGIITKPEASIATAE